ncbi:MAG: YjhG/YagF family D-xylonate dehydratase [Planctomycetaceae bacterium]
MAHDTDIYRVETTASGPAGLLPLTDAMLRERPSGDLFGLSQNVGMGWPADRSADRQFLVLSTLGGIRAPDGRPIALGYHTGHWEVGLLVEEAATAIRDCGGLPFAGFCSDPCDGRTQGTTGMFDSLPYRNDAAIVLRRLARSLPLARGIVGVATCDKGLPAMLMALAGLPDLPAGIVPGGVTLPPKDGEDAGRIQTIGIRYAHGQITLEQAADLGCRACATPGGGCQFLGTAATTQVVAEALGLTLPHAALAPSGQPVWRDMAARTARAVVRLADDGLTTRDILTERSFANAIAVHAAFGGSTNLLLHVPAIAHAAGLRIPTVDDWIAASRRVPRLVSVLPNGPVHHPTVRVFLAGGVPEVMLHLDRLGLLDTSARTLSGGSIADMLDEWERSERRRRFRDRLAEDTIDPDDVILPPTRARENGLPGTLACPRGTLAPEGSVVKATALDRRSFDPDGVYRHCGPARIFTSEKTARVAIKGGMIRAGDVVVLAGIGPMGTGMEETYQVTSALKHLADGHRIALVTDARFSGVSTGACIGHVGPEALAGGPLGRLVEGDLVSIVIDPQEASGSIDLAGHGEQRFTPAAAARELASRSRRADLAEDPHLPDDTRLWAALQGVSGGTWSGCVYDSSRITAALRR